MERCYWPSKYEYYGVCKLWPPVGGSRDGTSQHTPPAGRDTYLYERCYWILNVRPQSVSCTLGHPLLDTPHVQMQTLGCPSMYPFEQWYILAQLEFERYGKAEREGSGREICACFFGGVPSATKADGLLFSAPPLTADAETRHLCVVLTYRYSLAGLSNRLGLKYPPHFSLARDGHSSKEQHRVPLQLPDHVGLGALGWRGDWAIKGPLRQRGVQDAHARGTLAFNGMGFAGRYMNCPESRRLYASAHTIDEQQLGLSRMVGGAIHISDRSSEFEGSEALSGGAQTEHSAVTTTVTDHHDSCRRHTLFDPLNPTTRGYGTDHSLPERKMNSADRCHECAACGRWE
ncbi:uncharacterized protein Triagg1_10055 [Trichoderma aggressivum f. europaeum]|uniref:Uncharacterized protein n=1 Tax=Trichoderma aggressivum f. europaeum TaxID=173218 RepID=A0AAE1LV77_9HYPO|nr:hypothetical protein Triagg1_10055 [Trichoderma aggressivum f. europaeum]